MRPAMHRSRQSEAQGAHTSLHVSLGSEKITILPPTLKSYGACHSRRRTHQSPCMTHHSLGHCTSFLCATDTNKATRKGHRPVRAISRPQQERPDACHFLGVHSHPLAPCMRLHPQCSLSSSDICVTPVLMTDRRHNKPKHTSLRR